MEILLMFCGCWFIFSSLIVKANDFKSSLVFKVMPFFTGAITCICAMDIMGWINVF
jgi:hypothetical protein